MTINYTNFSLPRITAGSSGEAAISMLNKPIIETEKAIRDLYTGLSNINSKSAIIRHQVPIANNVAVGHLVYFDYESSSFKPAIAELRAIDSTKEKQVATIESPKARVEGIIIATDKSSATGTILCGGYYHSNTVIDNCLGTNATKGTYYLSPANPGTAVKETELGGHLRQPVLSYHGNGLFTMSLFYMAHDNHFHGSFVMGSNWKKASSITDTSIPARAIWVYDDKDDDALVNMGVLSKSTTAVFYNGLLQEPDKSFIISGGYLWTTLPIAPEPGSVTIFNHYPFAYDSPIIRSIESTNPSLVVKNNNGVVQLTQNAFISGATSKNALAISAISDNIIQYTPVVTDLIAGPGIALQTSTDGTKTISSSSILGTLIDAANINHNGTTVTSDGIYQYITYPKGRSCSFTMQTNITNVNPTDELEATAWCMVIGSSASFNVEMLFIPEPTSGTVVELNTNKVSSTLSVAGGANSIGLSDTPNTIKFTGNGTLIAKVSNETVNDAVKVFRTGFRLSLVKAGYEDLEKNASSAEPINPTTAITNTLISGYSAAIYDLVYVTNGRLQKCTSGAAESGNMCVGIAINNCNSGDELEYMITGIIQNPSFNFIPGEAVYVGVDGRMTQSTDPSMYYIQKVGMALTSTAVQINIEPAVMTDR